MLAVAVIAALSLVAPGLVACGGPQGRDPGAAPSPAVAAPDLPRPSPLPAPPAPGPDPVDAAPAVTGPAATPPPAAPGPPAADPAPAAPVPAEPPPPPDPVPGPAPAPAPAPTFQASTSPITPALAARMHASWRPGCPVPLEDLRYVTVTHRTFDGGTATGELVVHADLADGVVGVFRTLFAAGYPIALMRLVDDFAADDDASMAANNTSAFNCRSITGGTGWSEHSYGRALDLNPVQNPYVLGGTVLPPAGARYVDRPEEPGVLHAGDAVVTAFAAAGWSWGGAWTRPLDYQHFSTTGR